MKAIKGSQVKLASFVSLVLGLGFGFGFGCGAERISMNRSKSLKKLDIRDAKVNANANSQGENGEDEQKKRQNSVLAFTDSVYPLSVKWCAGGCHDTIQAPVFASDDAQASHDALLTTQKVDFQDIEKSRIVLRVSQDNHNCPSEGCEVATDQFIKAIEDWAIHIEEEDSSKQSGLLTTPLTLADAEGTKKDSGLPPGTFLFEAETGTLKAPMVAMAVPGASEGMVVHTPQGSGSQNNINTAENQANLGSVTFNLEINKAGNYRIIGRVNAPANANSSFYLKVDQGRLLLWDFQATQANYNFDIADGVAGVGTPHNINFTVGKHTLEIRQREEQAKLDTIIVTDDTEIDPMMVKPAPREMKSLGFDVSGLTGVTGAKMTIDVADYSKNGYLLKNLALVVPEGKIRVKGIKLLVNGKYLPQHATFNSVDAEIAAPGGSVSSASLVAIKDKGPELDQFSFTFDVLERVP